MPAALAKPGLAPPSPALAEPVAGFDLAGIGVRWVAMMIDSLYVLALGIVVGIALMSWVEPDFFLTESSDAGVELLFTGVLVVIGILYEAVMLSRRGQTVGKVLMSVQVRRSSATPLSTEAAWKRAVARWMLSVIRLLAIINYATGVFSQERRTLHDRAANTMVFTWVSRDDRPGDGWKVVLWAFGAFVAVAVLSAAATVGALIVDG
jgi:uncharacterized RDD family membrane protein YckC